MVPAPPITLTPLELPGWLEFNAWRTGLKVHHSSTELGDGVRADAVLYVDRRGRVKLPPNNPYLAVVFRSPHEGSTRRTGEWHRAVAPLVEEMKRRGSGNQLYLPPDITDVRPWIGRGFFVGVRYTYILDLPFDEALQTRETRRRIRRAEAQGLTVARTADVDLVHRCLSEGEARQGFSTDVGPPQLRTASDLIGQDNLRMYVCQDPAGRPLSACTVLHVPGARAVGWLAGGSVKGVAEGASRLLFRFAFDDLALADATGLDMAGANIPSVATFKSYFGARLAPNFAIRTYSPRTAARFALDWLRSRRPPNVG
jgi:hypothetical protein